MVALEIRKVKGSILIGVLTITGIAWAFHLVHWTPSTGGIGSLTANRVQARHHRRDQQRPARNHLRLLLCRPLRQSRNARCRHQARRPHRARPLHSTAQPHSFCRRNRDRLRLAHRNLHRDQLRGVHRRRGRGWPLRRHRHRHRSALSGAIVAAPFIGIVPPAATAPALILVGSLMLAAITEIHWHDPLVAVPAFLTLILIPFTYSIANGLGFGIIAWAVLHLFAGKARRAGLAALPPRRSFPGPLHLPRRKLEPAARRELASICLYVDFVLERQPYAHCPLH